MKHELYKELWELSHNAETHHESVEEVAKDLISAIKFLSANDIDEFDVLITAHYYLLKCS